MATDRRRRAYPLERETDRRLFTPKLSLASSYITRIINDKLDPTRLDDLTVIDELSFRRNHDYVTVVDHVRQRFAIVS